MLVTGDFISAEEAYAKGLVNRVAAPEAFDAEVEALVARIVAKPRVAVAMGKAGTGVHRKALTELVA
jgi:enoyl-CoA hydratase/carnithine racemase